MPNQIHRRNGILFFSVSIFYNFFKVQHFNNKIFRATKRVKIMSWNIDSLDPNNIGRRAAGVAKVINQ